MTSSLHSDEAEFNRGARELTAESGTFLLSPRLRVAGPADEQAAICCAWPWQAPSLQALRVTAETGPAPGSHRDRGRCA